MTLNLEWREQMQILTPIRIQLNDAFKTLVEVDMSGHAIAAYGVIAVISERQEHMAIKAYKAAAKAVSRLSG